MDIEKIIKRAVADHIVQQGRENQLRELLVAELGPIEVAEPIEALTEPVTDPNAELGKVE